MIDFVQISNGKINFVNFSDSVIHVVFLQSPIAKETSFSSLDSNYISSHTIQSKDIMENTYKNEIIALFSYDGSCIIQIKKIKERTIVCVKNDEIQLTRQYCVYSYIKIDKLTDEEVLVVLKIDIIPQKDEAIKESLSIKYVETLFDDSKQLCPCRSKTNSVREKIRGICCFKNSVYAIRNKENFIQAYNFEEKRYFLLPINHKLSDSVALTFTKDDKNLFISQYFMPHILKFEFSGDNLENRGIFDVSDELNTCLGLIELENGNIAVLSRFSGYTTDEDMKGSLTSLLEILSPAAIATKKIKIYALPVDITEIKSGEFKGNVAITHKHPAKCVIIYSIETSKEVTKIANKSMITDPSNIIWVDKFNSLFVTDVRRNNIVRIHLLPNEMPLVGIVTVGISMNGIGVIRCDRNEQFLFIVENFGDSRVHCFEIPD